eukprot:76227_1
MALYVQETSSQMEGYSDNAIDLSKFKDVMAALKQLQMFESYFSTFTKNNVDDEALLCLQKDDIKDLIVKIGDRARFMKWLNVYKNKNNDTADSKMKEMNKSRAKQPCSMCKGDKQIKIAESYTERRACGTCGGQGGSRGRWQTSSCSACNGSGYTKYYSTYCTDGCGKKGPNTCDWCDGSPWKHRECETCNGKKTQRQFDNNFWQNCNGCGGQGTMQQNKTRDKWVVCTTCKGQGQY